MALPSAAWAQTGLVSSLSGAAEIVSPVTTATPIPPPYEPPEPPKPVIPTFSSKELYSCVKGARALGLKVPPIVTPRDLKPNAEPQVGAGVLLDYGVPHIAVLLDATPTGYLIAETNYKKGKYGERLIPLNDPHLRGFWVPA